jgi:hypothetical protein
MNYHLFVLICTVVFYAVFRIYKYNNTDVTQDSKQSNLIYVLIVPAMLYLAKYWYFDNVNDVPHVPHGSHGSYISHKDFTSSSSDTLMTKPYPDSSILSTN